MVFKVPKVSQKVPFFIKTAKKHVKNMRFSAQNVHFKKHFFKSGKIWFNTIGGKGINMKADFFQQIFLSKRCCRIMLVFF